MTDAGAWVRAAVAGVLVVVFSFVVVLIGRGDWGFGLIGAAAVAGFLVARRRDRLGPLGSLVLLVLIPWVMWQSLAGDTSLASRLHPATMYLFALMVSGWRPDATTPPPILQPRLRGERFLLGIQLLFIALAGLMTLWIRGFRGLAILVDNYLGPFLLFWLLVWSFRSTGAMKKDAGLVIALVGATLSFFGTVEFLAAQNPLYEPFYGDVPWFPYATGEYRSTVTFGAPLALANFLLLCVVAIPAIPTLAVRMWLMALLVLGILATGSRSATALVLLVSPVVVLAVGERHAGKVSIRRAILAMTGFATFAALLVIATPLGRFVAGRVANAWQSTAVRAVSADFFLQSAGTYAVRGVGLGGSTDVSTAVLGSYITFENPWIMLAVDLGIPIMLLFLLTVLTAIAIPFQQRSKPWGAVAAIGALLLMESAYNAFGVRSIAGYCLWAGLAFCWPTRDS